MARSPHDPINQDPRHTRPETMEEHKKPCADYRTGAHLSLISNDSLRPQIMFVLNMFMEVEWGVVILVASFTIMLVKWRVVIHVANYTPRLAFLIGYM